MATLLLNKSSLAFGAGGPAVIGSREHLPNSTHRPVALRPRLSASLPWFRTS